MQMRGIATTLLGALICGAAWYCAWSDIGLASRYSFFPLWLGYIVLVNGVTELIFHDSLFRRAGMHFAWLFALSVPFWWFFEFLNRLVQNWHYLFAAPVSSLHFAVESSIDFSTVIPAVMSTTFLFYLLLNARRRRPTAPRGLPSARTMGGVFVVGLLGLLSLWLAPMQTFPLVWIAPVLLIEPVLYFAGWPSLLRRYAHGDRLLLAAAMSATLFTGFWWECWNYYSLPKWVYTVPYVGFWKVFEMPILGYLGYPFFGLIVFGYTVLAVHLCCGEGARLREAIVRGFDLGGNAPHMRARL